jgi:hypothetical protein
MYYFFSLGDQSLGALHYYWPVTLALVAGLGAAAIFNFPFLRSRFHRRQLLVFLPLGVSVLNLVWGSVIRHTDAQSLAPGWPSHVVGGLLIVQLLTSIAVVCGLKGYRWFSAAVVLLELWVGVAFAFGASMSVSGNWL